MFALNGMSFVFKSVHSLIASLCLVEILIAPSSILSPFMFLAVISLPPILDSDSRRAIDCGLFLWLNL